MRMICLLAGLGLCASAASAEFSFVSQGGAIAATISGGGGQAAGLPLDTPVDTKVTASWDYSGSGVIARASASAKTSWSADAVRLSTELFAQHDVPASLELPGVTQTQGQISLRFLVDAPTVVRTKLELSGSDTGGQIAKSFSLYLHRVLAGGGLQIVHAGPTSVTETLAAGTYQLSVNGDVFMGLSQTLVPEGTAAYTLAASVEVAPCVADCDGSGVLDVNDFVCFQNAFALGDLTHADCDESGALDINDFTCFQNQFALGCP